MSQRNADFVRRAYALLDQGDETVWALVPPDFVLDFSRRGLNPAVLRGPTEMRVWFEREWEVWGGQVAWEPLELIDAGDKVLAFYRTVGRGNASGVEVEACVWNLWRFRDGRPVECTYYGDDEGAARKAAGLEH